MQPNCSARRAARVACAFRVLRRAGALLRRAAPLAPFATFALMLALPSLSFAQTAGLPAFNTSPGPNGGTTYSLSVQTMLLLTMLSFLPAMVLMMTSFTRIIIVLSLLRQALGTTTTPPNQAETRPSTTPTTIETVITERPMNREMRLPYIRRESMSRPSGSVPRG